MSDISARTSQVIAAEINGIKDQTRKMALLASIEIGQRLVEVKAMLEHGQWGEWLKEAVDYSQSTAQNLMRIYQEYGSNQSALYEGANSQALGDLSYTQAVALLGIPADEREAFIEEHDVPNMSSRELQNAVKRAAELQKKLEKAQEQNRQLVTSEASAREDLIKERVKNQNDVNALTLQIKQAQAANSAAAVAKLEKQLEEAQKKLIASSAENSELKEELKKPIEPAIIEVIPEDTTRELNELREKLTQDGGPLAMKFKIYFESLTEDFKKLLNVLEDMRMVEPEMHLKYSAAVGNLISTMTTTVKVKEKAQ